MFAERLGNPFCHEEIESGNGLSAVLFVLVGLEDDSSQRGVTLNTLRRTDASVLGAESPFEEIVHIVLNAGSRLRGIIIEIVDVDVTQLVRFGKTFGKIGRAHV